MASVCAIAMLVVAAVVAAVFVRLHAPPRPPPRVRSTARSGRASAAHPEPPSAWSWKAVGEEDALLYARATGSALRAGQYASAPANQHFRMYCGCCFLVATVQCVQDRMNIAARDSVRGSDFRVYEFDLQRAVDDFSKAHARAQRSLEETGIHMQQSNGTTWNACMGGEPVDVAAALLSGALRLVRAHPWARWTSRACSSSAGEEERGNDARIAYPIRDYRLLDPEDIAGLKAAVLRGPLVVGVRSDALWRMRAGRPVQCEGGAGADRDHVVSVVGWRQVDGLGDHWVARNSWGNGRDEAIWSRPADVRACTQDCAASAGGAPGACESAPVVWTNGAHEDGLVLLPVCPNTNCAGIYDAPSGGVEVRV